MPLLWLSSAFLGGTALGALLYLNVAAGLAEGGYARTNPPERIERWKPQVILLSVAVDDPDGRLDPETLAAVEGYTLLRTDLAGWIEVSTDGMQMWVEMERK